MHARASVGVAYLYRYLDTEHVQLYIRKAASHMHILLPMLNYVVLGTYAL